MQDPLNPGRRASKAVIGAEIANTFYASETVPSTVAWTL